MRIVIIMVLVCFAILQHMVIGELKSEVTLNKELFKACSAELQWQTNK